VTFFINVSNGGKKEVIVSVKQHLSALQTQDKGKTIERVAEEQHWPCHCWWLEEGWMQHWKLLFWQTFKWRAERYTVKECEYRKVCEALICGSCIGEWGAPLTGPVLQEKALTFHTEFIEGGSEFTASRAGYIAVGVGTFGWVSLCGEMLLTNLE